MPKKKNKLKILFLYDFPLWGSGSGTFLRHLVYQLYKDGMRVAIAAPEKRRFNQRIKQYYIKLSQIPVFIAHPELKKAKKCSELRDREILDLYNAYIKAMLKIVKDFEPDIIHVNHLSMIAWVARYIKSMTNVKFIITCHGSDLHFISQDRRYYLLTLDALRGASQITAVSGDTRQWLIKMFGEEMSSKLRTVPGGIDIRLYPPRTSITSINRRYKLAGKNVILFTGRLVKPKGVEYLVRAAKKINGEVYILGEGPERKSLTRLARNLKLKNVHFLGYFSAKRMNIFRKFYYRANVFVAPSIWEEPLGLTILEAMACKTPVVVTRKGGIPLAVKNGINGLFVKPRNASDIAEKVNRLLVNKKRRKRMGEEARRIVKQKFTWDKIAKKFEYIYRKHAL